jgi:protein gp37
MVTRDWWWDATWNPVGGCSPASPGCALCYAAQEAGTKTWPFPGASGTNDGVTVARGRRRIFNGRLTTAPDGHEKWTWPLRWPGAQQPALGPGAPSLIFVGDMSDVFHEHRSAAVIDRVAATVAASEHVGLLLTKRARRMRAYFTSQSPRTVRRWQPKLWLGFSAERQREFDDRWAEMRALAGAGWRVFVSVAPMLEPVTLPEDLLALGPRVWIIVAGEQGPHALCRDLEPDWARAVRDQCALAGVPFFFKQMARGEPIPLDLRIRQFPTIKKPGPLAGTGPLVVAV